MKSLIEVLEQLGFKTTAFANQALFSKDSVVLRSSKTHKIAKNRRLTREYGANDHIPSAKENIEHVFVLALSNPFFLLCHYFE